MSPAGAPDHDSWGEVSVAPSTPLKAEYRGSARGAPVLLHRRGSCRVSTWEDPLMSCPRCMSVSVTKDGTTPLGGQRFRCSQCGRRFTRRSSSAFSGRAFPDDIIALAVRWYVRYRLSYVEVSEWLAERGVLVDQSTILPLGTAFPAAVRRGGAKVPRTRRSGLASRRDVRSYRRPLALPLARH